MGEFASKGVVGTGLGLGIAALRWACSAAGLATCWAISAVSLQHRYRRRRMPRRHLPC